MSVIPGLLAANARYAAGFDKGDLPMPPQAFGNGQVGLAQTQQFGLQHPVLRLVGEAHAFAGARLISGRAVRLRRHRAAFLWRASSQMAQPSTRAKTGIAKKPTTANIDESMQLSFADACKE